MAGKNIKRHEQCEDDAKTIHLFNGRDMNNFYVFLQNRGKNNDPNKVFTVRDKMIRISGEEYGYLATKEIYENYHLIAEFKWGEQTFGSRRGRARDSGILLNSVGEDGAAGGVWMHSIEAQIIEGGTGDFIVIGDETDNFFVTCPVADERTRGFYNYQPGGKDATICAAGQDDWRINRWSRDPNWEDIKGFRDKDEIEKPTGQWNRFECIVKGQTIKIILNGVLVNECTNVKPQRGKIQIQSEGAEVFFRRLDLIPLQQSSK
ncbi:MAG: DUF1080 domain-containing protein [Sedimentisphaerales bacterium]|nr:DUF1080 domain-containing protein [Sedimentisphaerales bacterium]